MKLYEELQARGLIAQVTHKEKVKDLLNNQQVKFYIGFDPTADSLHVGHLIPIIAMAHMQKAGHTPIALFGGGTGMIGDPSGKTDMRQMMTRETVEHNIDCFQEQMSKLIDFTNDKAVIVNNADWLLNLNYVNFLREIGIHFSVNRMISAECYKQRLENGLSFFELNYMIMQSYDFLKLNRRYNCQLQLGGNDQWRNIIGGVELIRRCDKKEAFGLTFSLLTTRENKKMGKTEEGTVWLNPEKTSPFEFYQFWRNIDDADVIKCLKMLTFYRLEKIEKMSSWKGSALNRAKEILAFESTKLIHGKEKAKKAQEGAKALFDFRQDTTNMPSTIIHQSDLTEQKIAILDLLLLVKLTLSKGEGRRLIEQGGISIDNIKITNVLETIPISTFKKSYIIIKKGKKIYHKVVLEV